MFKFRNHTYTFVRACTMYMYMNIQSCTLLQTSWGIVENDRVWIAVRFSWCRNNWSRQRGRKCVTTTCSISCAHATTIPSLLLCFMLWTPLVASNHWTSIGGDAKAQSFHVRPRFFYRLGKGVIVRAAITRIDVITAGLHIQFSLGSSTSTVCYWVRPTEYYEERG